MRPPREGTLKRFKIITMLFSVQITNVFFSSITARAHTEKISLRKSHIWLLKEAGVINPYLANFFLHEDCSLVSVQADGHGVVSTLSSLERRSSGCSRVAAFFSAQKGLFPLGYMS